MPDNGMDKMALSFIGLTGWNGGGVRCLSHKPEEIIAALDRHGHAEITYVLPGSLPRKSAVMELFAAGVTHIEAYPRADGWQ